jgi:hypothetical protein
MSENFTPAWGFLLLMLVGAFIAVTFGLGVAQAFPPGPPPGCNPGWHYDPVVIHCQPDLDNPEWYPGPSAPFVPSHPYLPGGV